MANTVRYFYDISASVSTSSGNEIIKFGKTYDPTTVTLSSDRYIRKRIDVPSETVTLVNNSVGRTLLVPSVAGRASWTCLSDADSSSLNVPAGVPLLVPRESVPYNALVATRATGTPEDVYFVYFYQDSGATAYVDVFSVV